MAATQTIKLQHDLLEAGSQLPCISIVLPFAPVMEKKEELAARLKDAFEEAAAIVKIHYTATQSISVLNKLGNTIRNLNYSTHQHAVAIFVSPLIEKVYYLDMDVEPVVVVDDSFGIKNLVYHKRTSHRYLLAWLDEKFTKIFLLDDDHCGNLISNNITSAGNNELMQRTDNGLRLLLHAYPFPVFVMGSETSIQSFKSITANGTHVVEYLPKILATGNLSHLHETMKMYTANWKMVRRADFLNQIQEAILRGTMATGIGAVSLAASRKTGLLLLALGNFKYPLFRGRDSDLKNKFFIKDAVDDVIEKALSNGSDVEFVDPELLDDYGHIVFISKEPKYYSSDRRFV